jgi:putative phage-type endonuclease
LPEQRTPEWFKQRQTRITASEAASCLFKTPKVCDSYLNQFNITKFKFKENEPLNPYETIEDYIIKKCSSFYGESVFRDNPATLWGKKYEEVATRLYSKLNNTIVHEFGLVPHSKIKWLAASPDGITGDGVMLEIKCPKSRKIDESAPPLYYWVQTQIQLEVCDLDVCDFLECEIEELKDETEFINKTLQAKQDLGIVLQVPGHADGPKYVYPPLQANTQNDYILWKNEFLKQVPEAIPTYFFISKYNIISIHRSKEWFANVKDDIKRVWDKIKKFQENEEDFLKYKQSINLIKNKVHIDRVQNTVCLIDDNSTYLFSVDVETTCENISPINDNSCIIHSSE